MITAIIAFVLGGVLTQYVTIRNLTRRFNGRKWYQHLWDSLVDFTFNWAGYIRNIRTRA